MFRTVASCIVFSLILGCSSQPPAVQTAKKVEAAPSTDFTVLPKPAKSDPAALKLLQECLKAHTNGDLSKLVALKKCTLTRTGTLELAPPVNAVEAEWRLDLSWPDQYRYHTRLTMNGDTKVWAAGTSPKPWSYLSVTEKGQREPKQQSRSELKDAASKETTMQFHEDAFFLLFPLADPETIVVLAEETTIGGNPALALRVWTPALDHAIITIDEKTKLILRFVYEGLEQGTPLVKSLTYGKHEEQAGVKFPTEIEVSAPQRVLARWKQVKVEPHKIFEPKAFETP